MVRARWNGICSGVRGHVSGAGVIATVALVFAMSGGAYAANRYLITSTKQISPKVLKSLKGANGKNGANGAPGATGATGPAGPQGPQGNAGANGTNGTAGINGTDGKEGAPGKEGSPWTAGGTLPSGKTETGVWTAQTTAEGQVPAPISFTIPLAEGLSGADVHFIAEGAPSTTECPGSVETPLAEKGQLCVYADRTGSLSWESIAPPFDNIRGSGTGGNGAIVWFTLAEPEAVTAWGSWGVTAP
jgi:hypothetical protein